MTSKELDRLAEMVAEKIAAKTDQPIPIDEVIRIYGWSKSFLYKNHKRMGAVKAGGRIFFFPYTLNLMIRSGELTDNR